MRSPRRLVAAGGLLTVAAAIAAIGAAPLFVSGADHLDSPLVKTDARLDMTDIYAWRTSPTTTTLALEREPAHLAGRREGSPLPLRTRCTSSGSTPTGTPRRRSPTAIRFSGLRTFADGTVDQVYTVKRSTGPAARRTEWTWRHGRDRADHPVTAMRRGSPRDPGGGSAFAGPRDDPFFFDLVGFKHLKSRVLAGRLDLGSVNDGPNCALADDDPAAKLLSCFTGSDTFAGTDISGIVIRLPNARLGGTGHTVGVWATTAMAGPARLAAHRPDGPAGHQHRLQHHRRGEGPPEPRQPRRRPVHDEGHDGRRPGCARGGRDERRRDGLHPGPDQRDRQRPPAGHADGQARRRRRVPQRPQAGR